MSHGLPPSPALLLRSPETSPFPRARHSPPLPLLSSPGRPGGAALLPHPDLQSQHGTCCGSLRGLLHSHLPPDIRPQTRTLRPPSSAQTPGPATLWALALRVPGLDLSALTSCCPTDCPMASVCRSLGDCLSEKSPCPHLSPVPHLMLVSRLLFPEVISLLPSAIRPLQRRCREEKHYLLCSFERAS